MSVCIVIKNNTAAKKAFSNATTFNFACNDTKKDWDWTKQSEHARFPFSIT